ncbi:MBL fold metallo-hydrolase [Embleya sp. AB8]|uniref:MBL fold metallo-hydrolase n=1 Tax=Embleya sp. AB8 TaxID=3156304 RepID=UPI003C71D364
MQLTVLGCRSGMPADGQASSGYLVTSAGARILLDCGPGVMTGLGTVTRPDRLDAVVISHMHLDHCYDLLPLGKRLLAATVPYPGDLPESFKRAALPPRRADRGRLPLYVPAGARDVLDRLAALFPVTTMPLLDQAFELAFEVREYTSGDDFAVGDCRVDVRELRHAAPNCGVRVTGPDGTLVYTGDTGVTDALPELARDSDLLLAEATLEQTDNGAHGHLSAADAGRAAAAAGAGQLVLTHFVTADPDWLAARRAEAAAVYAGPVLLAHPGARFDVRKGS